MKRLDDNNLKINVIGLGYIGLPTALMLTKGDFEIVGTDFNQRLIDKLVDRTMRFSESGMKELFEDACSRNIRFTTEYEQADVYIVAVPTPYIKVTKKVDASYVADAVTKIIEVCPENSIIIIESTISPGTIDSYIRPIIREYKNVNIAHAPERIIPGKIITELNNNSRIIGADDAATGNLVKAIYQSFCKGEIVVTDIRTAEMTKVVENTYRDINIAFANRSEERRVGKEC